MGGSAAGDASVVSQPGEIDRLVLLGAALNKPAEKLKSPILFIVGRNDASADGPRLPGIEAQYEKAPLWKELIVLDGTAAHAQFLFQTNQADPRQAPTRILLRTKRRGLLRTAALIVGNRGDARALPALRRLLTDSDPILREAAAWAVERIEKLA